MLLQIPFALTDGGMINLLERGRRGMGREDLSRKAIGENRVQYKKKKRKERNKQRQNFTSGAEALSNGSMTPVNVLRLEDRILMPM